MKRIILIIFTLLLSLTMNAQWLQFVSEADELKGTQADDCLVYQNEVGRFVIGRNSGRIVIATFSGVFDSHYARYLGDRSNVLIGFYDKEGKKMLTKETMNCPVAQGSRSLQLAGASNKNFFNRILTHLNGVGCIRIVAGRYADSDFDLLIPMISFDNETAIEAESETQPNDSTTTGLQNQ